VEKSISVAKKQEARFIAIQTFVLENKILFIKSGTMAECWKTYRGRRIGPYYRLAFREDGKQKSIYLGRDPELASRAAQLLSELQAPHRIRRETRLLRMQILNSFRRELKNLDPYLPAIGYRRKGTHFHRIQS
jgi:hypothetical protein